MEAMERINIYRDASIKWGEKSQMIAAIEEFSELIDQIAKQLNGKTQRKNIIDEIADARIMIEQLEYNLCCGHEVETRVEDKLIRLKKILSGQGEKK